MYKWIHLRCVHKIGSAKEKNNETWYYRKQSKCSYCGKKTPAKDRIYYGKFALHKKCIPEMLQKIKETLEREGKQLVTESI